MTSNVFKANLGSADVGITQTFYQSIEMALNCTFFFCSSGINKTKATETLQRASAPENGIIENHFRQRNASKDTCLSGISTIRFIFSFENGFQI